MNEKFSKYPTHNGLPKGLTILFARFQRYRCGARRKAKKIAENEI
jgi:hypothetical protein